MGHRDADAVERDAEMQQSSPAERRFAEEGIEDKKADSAVEERLGGIDPERLLDDEEPPRD